MNETLINKVKRVFGIDKVVCRLLAAWLAYSGMRLLAGKGFSTVNAGEELSLVTLAFWCLILFAVYSLMAFLHEKYPTDSWFLLLSATVCSYSWIVGYSGEKHFLVTLAVLAVYALILVWCVYRNRAWLKLWNPSSRTVWILAALFAVTAAVILSVITCLRYKTFGAPNYDFGLFCNMFENMRKTGLPMITSERDTYLSHFAVHISPIFYLLLPFYYIFPTPETLQIGQAVILMLGVIPVVLLAKHFKVNSKATIILALIYCFYPVLSTGCFYDIHENCFLPFFLLWTFYFFEKQKWIPMYLSALCVLAVKEDAAIFLLLFAVYAIFSRKRYLHGGILAAASVAYFLFATHLINTYGDGVLSNRFDNLIPNPESGVIGIVKVALTNPGFLLTQLFTEGDSGWDKIQYFLMMFLPLGMLPFCTKRASRWLLLTPLLLNLLSYYPYLYNTGFQYHFGALAFLFYAAAQNVAELKPPVRRNLLSIAAAACCCLYLFSVIPSWTGYTKNWEENKDRYVYMDEILDTLPKDASLNVSTFLLAHVADHDEVYEVGYHGNKADVDFVVLDKRYFYYDTEAAYLSQGYTVYGDYEDLILILQKGTDAAPAS